MIDDRKWQSNLRSLLTEARYLKNLSNGGCQKPRNKWAFSPGDKSKFSKMISDFEFGFYSSRAFRYCKTNPWSDPFSGMCFCLSSKPTKEHWKTEAKTVEKHHHRASCAWVFKIAWTKLSCINLGLCEKEMNNLVVNNR